MSRRLISVSSTTSILAEDSERPSGPVRRDEGRDHDQSRIEHQSRHLRGAPNVLHAVGLGEAEIAVQPLPQIVPVQHADMPPGRHESVAERAGEGRFSGGGETREPDATGALALEQLSGSRADVGHRPIDIPRMLHAEFDRYQPGHAPHYRCAGGDMSTRPLMPAMRSPNLPWMVALSLIDWLNGSTRAPMRRTFAG
jgi:hypothetical protein